MRFSSSSSRARTTAWLGLIFAGLHFPLIAQDVLPEGKGKETLENTCTECHGLDKVFDKLRTTENWRKIAAEMRTKGATMSDSELNTLVEYLSLNFGAIDAVGAKPSPKININKATLKEIQDGLQLQPSEAAAIIRYRQNKRRFNEWRDLLKVVGIDRVRIEAVKDRILFKEP